MYSDMLVAAAIAKLSSTGWSSLDQSRKSCLAEVILGSLPQQFIMELATRICSKKANNEVASFRYREEGDCLMISLINDPKNILPASPPIPQKHVNLNRATKKTSSSGISKFQKLPSPLQNTIYGPPTLPVPKTTSVETTLQSTLQDIQQRLSKSSTVPSASCSKRSPESHPQIMLLATGEYCCGICGLSKGSHDTVLKHVKLVHEKRSPIIPTDSLTLVSDDDEMKLTNSQPTTSKASAPLSGMQAMLQNLLPSSSSSSKPKQSSPPQAPTIPNPEKYDQHLQTNPQKLIDIKDVPSKIVARMIMAKRKRISNHILCSVPGCDHKSNCALTAWKHLQTVHNHHSFCSTCYKICDAAHLEQHQSTDNADPPCKKQAKLSPMSPVKSNDELPTMSMT